MLKKDDRSNLKNYRPLSLAKSPCKKTPFRFRSLDFSPEPFMGDNVLQMQDIIDFILFLDF